MKSTPSRRIDPTPERLDGKSQLLVNRFSFETRSKTALGTRTQRIRMVAAATGITTAVAGNGTLGYSGDLGVATSAELHCR